eukprot:CAMPEP_0206247434 /NCGR_PEP_ID=MMETSP0047_2-20121206/19808_1 /ASSEMBLY_ACC=CAM_ASM_000192 /TAXON_ID=195065 /ORGANISM="Chroomonas mesostigmatica_cf, Strain CCMP1168" /LENGTH=35 /DNA_ID= /DNA_START= /DNA_END= /DNA_ORIENTATION=
MMTRTIKPHADILLLLLCASLALLPGPAGCFTLPP